MAIKKSELYSSIWQACDQLRGGMDASQYKDYVLVLLFVKYVSDKYGNDPDALIVIPTSDEPGKGGSFADMSYWKGKEKIGDEINKIIGRLADANNLKGVIDVTDFNDSDKLGKGKAMVERLSNLVAIFEKPELDFSRNRAEGDDLLGDAYEYLMKNFAVQSGKSKGQFYTPAEVSRVMSKVIGISAATRASQTVYDPTCGSGSLLIKAASEANVDISVFGQEIDISMAGLAKMNMILHDIPTAVIYQDNTLSTPYFKNADGTLKAFDFAVANPPFSDKNWRNGLDPEHDEFNRFDGFGIPPNKNGDYAFLLHLIKSLKSTGKGAIILPHGVLFRGGSEGVIRQNIIKRGYIKGIIGLPPNLFYGTGIPACIIVIDKEDAANRKSIFFIDASTGFTKDGNKNRLREQDIHKIVDMFNNQKELAKYSRLVPVAEIEKNEYNLNIPRYIDSSEAEELQDIEAHLKGGIPGRDIDALQEYWKVFPELKGKLFGAYGREGYMKLSIKPQELQQTVLADPEFIRFKDDTNIHYDKWKTETANCLKAIEPGDKPKQIISQISEALLGSFKSNTLINAYEIYQILMQYWADVMQDDVYMIVVEGWKADKDLIPAELIIKRYFEAEQSTIDELEEQKDEINRKLEELDEEQSEEDDLFAEARNDKGKITKALVQSRIKAIRGDKDCVDELKALAIYLELIEGDAAIKTAIKTANKALDGKVEAKYKQLSEAEIKTLIVEDKWLVSVSEEVESALDMVSHRLTTRIKELAERYEQTMPELEQSVSELTQKVEAHLGIMGFTWK
ncbi:MAG: type I restriction-modification system subunit M [Candidatus Cloacimonetes bacterium]|nr:type I restriction-modification system subunit M [Candidatus Cloacimonadota bacterium]